MTTLEKLCDHRVLEDGEQRQLIMLAQGGDLDARNTVVECNGRLVMHVAKRRQSNKVPLDDLVSVGFVGLIRAVHLFDVGRRSGGGGLVRFSTYAVPHIKVKMQDLIKHRFLVHVPNYMQDLAHKVADGQEPRMTDAKSSCLKYCGDAMGIPDMVGMLESGEPNLDMLEDGRYFTDPLEAEDDRRLVRELRRTLVGKQQLVLSLRFGLDGGGARTLQECSEIMGLTKERVRQIQNAAVRRLRERAAC